MRQGQVRLSASAILGASAVLGLVLSLGCAFRPIHSAKALGGRAGLPQDFSLVQGELLRLDGDRLRDGLEEKLPSLPARAAEGPAKALDKEELEALTIMAARLDELLALDDLDAWKTFLSGEALLVRALGPRASLIKSAIGDFDYAGAREGLKEGLKDLEPGP